MPFQRRILSGSVKKGNTASGGADIRISCSMTSSPSGTVVVLHLLFDCPLQTAQSGLPEHLEVVAQLGQALGPGPVDDAGRVTPALEEPGVDQDAEMLGHGGPAELEAGCDLSRRELVVGDESEDFAPMGLGDGSEGGVHELNVSISLRKWQVTNAGMQMAIP